MNLPTPIDMMHLPALHHSDVQMFLSNNNSVNYQTWVKPRGATMCSMLAISGGGGGGGGTTRAAGNAGGGGGGGGCSGIARLVIPAYFLPDELYVQVGVGGLGGAAGSGGGSGSKSIINYGRTSATTLMLLISENSQNAAGATSGSGAGAGGGGAGADIAVIKTPAALGHFSAIAGVSGSSGGAHTGAVGVTVSGVFNTIPLSQGAGGAGCTTTDFAGGAITLGDQPDFPMYGVAGGTAAGANVDGNAGVQLWQPFYQTGGSGGGSNNSGQAGHGGKGGIGCGGGGGGAGTTGGRGGNGGNGLVLIVSW